jgi:acetoin utilization protein AcuB
MRLQIQLPAPGCQEDFGMRLNDIMETAVDTVEASASADSAWQRMRSRRIHHLVVMNGGTVAGIISDRDLGGSRGSDVRDGREVRDLMTPSVVAARPATTVRQAANLMRGRSIGCLPIIENGALRGIVTVTDLLELIGKGAERPTARAQRAVLRDRGPRRKPFKHW